MNTKDVTSRRDKILECIINTYIEMGVPIGSVTICQRFNLDLSPATLRNIMRELEDIGYIAQPHTSAGRVPTDAGYRYYVNKMMEPEKISEEEQCRIGHSCRSFKGSMEVLLEDISRILSEFTNQASVVLLPALKKNLLKELKLLSIGPKKIMAILIGVSGFVKNIDFEYMDAVNDTYLQKIAVFINNHCAGRSLIEMKGILKMTAILATDFSYYLCKDALEILDKIDIEHDADKLFLEGAHYLFRQPEFSDITRSRRVLEALEDKIELLEFLEGNLNNEGVKISIGRENACENIRDCSIVIAPYGPDESTLGAIGIIGPTRMLYKRVVSFVSYAAENISEVL